MGKVTTTDVINTLNELAELTIHAEGSTNSFRVRAYQEAAAAIEASSLTPAEMEDETSLVAVKGIGKGIAKMVVELVNTGSIPKLELLRDQFPPAYLQLARVPGLGPKKLAVLRTQLGIESVADLQRALDSGQIANLAGFGRTTQNNLKQNLERLGLAGDEQRTPLPVAFRLAQRLLDRLQSLPSVIHAEYAGSLRRFRTDIGDIDLLVTSTKPRQVMKAVVDLPEVEEVLLTGDTKTSFLTRDGIQVDVRVVEESQFGSALLYFTGSKNHNVALRKVAIGQGQLLNEYGLFDQVTKAVVASQTEAEIYHALGLPYIDPPLREGGGEVERAQADELPDVITRVDLCGDLHTHSDRSGDGRQSPRVMVEAAIAAGYQYLAFTEHGEDLAINGSSRSELREHRKLLEELDAEFDRIQVLWGCELNIGSKGELDYDPDFRSELAWNVASVHSYFDLPAQEQTQRLLTAIADPTVDCIGHLTGRKLGRRPGIELDTEVVLAAMAEHGVVLELNGALDRLDADTAVVRQALRLGVPLSINTDAHHSSEYIRMEYGVSHAQRAWVTATDVINTRPFSEFRRGLKRGL